MLLLSSRSIDFASLSCSEISDAEQLVFDLLWLIDAPMATLVSFFSLPQGKPPVGNNRDKINYNHLSVKDRLAFTHEIRVERVERLHFAHGE